MQWDLFCRVIDNYGDVGVCWRLAADLGQRGEQVRLWLDDAAALVWMAPEGARGVSVLPWDGSNADIEPGDVVIEAFGCDPPPAFVARMVRRQPAPVWINLEYLSAEAHARRNHGLRSPQLSGPGQGLHKWFFYPGFEPGTGGLILEPGLTVERQAFDGHAWLLARGITPRPGERVLSLFCYANAPVGALLQALADEPTLLLATPGAAAQALQAALARCPVSSALRCIALPWLAQSEYDRLLWACDLNFVRGEDSFVRAMWAGTPFVWQIYAQTDAAHATKLDALLDLMQVDADDNHVDADAHAALRNLWLAWNGLSDAPLVLPDQARWQIQAQRWRGRLLAQADLVSQLLGFVARKR